MGTVRCGFSATEGTFRFNVYNYIYFFLQTILIPNILICSNILSFLLGTHMIYIKLLSVCNVLIILIFIVNKASCCMNKPLRHLQILYLIISAVSHRTTSRISVLYCNFMHYRRLNNNFLALCNMHYR